jgi:hypothetical protein
VCMPLAKCSVIYNSKSIKALSEQNAMLPNVKAGGYGYHWAGLNS